MQNQAYQKALKYSTLALIAGELICALGFIPLLNDQISQNKITSNLCVVVGVFGFITTFFITLWTFHITRLFN